MDSRKQTSKCKRCDISFPYRPNKKFCSANCRKRANEPIQNSFNSKRIRQDNERIIERAKWLSFDYYRSKPSHRLNFIYELVSQAIYLKDNQLLNILTNKQFLFASYKFNKKYFQLYNPDDVNIAQAAQEMSLIAYGTPIKLYIDELLERKKRPSN